MCLEQEDGPRTQTQKKLKLKKKKKNHFIFQVPTWVEKSEAMDVRASTSPFSPNIADTLGDANIFTAAGDSVFFKDLWDQNRVCVCS